MKTLNESTISVPESVIDETIDVLITMVYRYFDKYDKIDISQYLSHNANDLVTIFKVKINNEKRIYGSMSETDIGKFKYVPIESTDNQIKTRIEGSIYGSLDSFFKKKEEHAFFRFNLTNLVDSIKKAVNLEQSKDVIQRQIGYLRKTVEHEWMHFVQTYILHPKQQEKKPDYDAGGSDYYTSEAEKLPILNNAYHEFYINVIDNDYWPTMSKEDHLNLVKQYVGMDSDAVRVVVNDTEIEIPEISQHELFKHYRKEDLSEYKNLVKKFIEMIKEHL